MDYLFIGETGIVFFPFMIPYHFNSIHFVSFILLYLIILFRRRIIIPNNCLLVHASLCHAIYHHAAVNAISTAFNTAFTARLIYFSLEKNRFFIFS